MPPHADPHDWDRLFRPKAPHRGGPVRALVNVLIAGAIIALLGGVAFLAMGANATRTIASSTATAQAVETSNAAVITSNTAHALVATVTPTATVRRTATPTVLAEPARIGRSSVVKGGNLRRQPVVSAETVVGQVCIGDLVDVLEENTLAGGARWYRIRVTQVTADCTAERVSVGSLGWASSALLAPPTSP